MNELLKGTIIRKNNLVSSNYFKIKSYISLGRKEVHK